MPGRDRANAVSSFPSAPEASGEAQIVEYRADGMTGSSRALNVLLPFTVVGLICRGAPDDRIWAVRAAGPTAAPAPLPSVQVQASSQTADGDPGRAVDGIERTSWNAGDHPPAWIELDLGIQGPVSAIKLLVEQSPEGPTVHHVFVAGDDGGYEHVHTFEGITRSGQWLTFTPTPLEDVRAVVIQTVDSPSWVAWREVLVLRP